MSRPTKRVKLHSDFAGRAAVTHTRMNASGGVAMGWGNRSTTMPRLLERQSDPLEPAYRQIMAHPEAADADNQALLEIVDEIGSEAFKEEEVDPGRLTQLLNSLADRSPDLLAVTADCLEQSRIAPAIRQAVESFRSIGEAGCDLGRLLSQVDGSEMPEGDKERVKSRLQALDDHLAKADSNNVRQFREALEEAVQLAPQIRPEIWRWLSTRQEMPPSIRILARRLLT